jgi:pyruvate formate-lyase activating enzyme-like uncharacterized protein
MIPNVTVEIPVIPRHEPKLIECLETWSALGVKYLNLHELLYEPGTNSARMTGSRCAVVLADGHRVEFDPESRDITLTIIEDVHRRRLPLFVNDCSLQCKIRQLRGRRRSLAPITRASHEKLVEDLVLESYHAWDAQGRSFACHPDILEEMQRKHPDCRFQKVQRLAPLSVREL